jgi:IclR family pca regulon transcriptional regulator
MGRVLLAALSPGALNRYFATATLTPFTEFTVVEPDALRERLEVVRAQGWCLARDEIEPGICGMAAPVMDPAGRTVAALSVSTRSDRISAVTAKNTILPLLHDAAATIRKELAEL